MVGGGVILMLIGLGLLVAYGFQRRKLVTLTVAKARTAGELAQTAKSIGQELGAGGFKELVEISGEIRCGRPLKFDPVTEQIVGDEEANRLVNQPMRSPWRL